MTEYYKDINPTLKYYMQNIYIGKKIILYDRTNKIIKTSIKGIVPILVGGAIGDFEIIINKRRNQYFSISRYYEGLSWVQSFEISQKRDKRIKVTVGYF